MKTTVDSLAGGVPDASPQSTPLTIYANAAWNLVVAMGSIWLAFVIFNMDEFYRLGDPVQVFVGLVALVPAVVALYSSALLITRGLRPADSADGGLWSAAAGRYAALALDYTGLVLSIVAMVTFWGVWDGFEFIVDGVLRVAWVTLGFAVAYVLNWLATRTEAGSRLHDVLQNTALAFATLTLAVILWFSGIAGGVAHVLGLYTDFSGDTLLTTPAVQVWLATISAVIFGVLAYRMLHLGPYFGESPFEREAWQGWLMLSPNIIGFTIFFAGPLLLSFYLSFTDSTVGQVPNVIWFQNYAEIASLEFKAVGDAASAQAALGFEFDVLTTFNWFGTEYVLGAKDTLFWRSLMNTLLFCLMLVPLSTIPAIGLALVLNSDIAGVNFFRAIYFLPSVAAVVGTATIWRWLYNPTVGYINYTISNIVNFLQWLGIPADDPAILWLSDPGVVLFSIVFLAAWQVVGFNTVLFLAGLQGIPNVLYEAASIDGANAWGRFRNVTLPMLAPTTFFVIITTIIQGLQVFNEPYTLFVNQQPIPTNATTSVYYLYRRGFFFFDFGYASAVAWILFGVIFVITFIQFRLQRADAYE